MTVPRPAWILRRLTRAAAGTGAGLRALRIASPDVVSIFLWHSVGSTSAPFFDPAGIEADASSHCSLAAFADHVSWIRSRFHVVPLDEALEILRAGGRGHGWIASLTFDDGFRNAAEEAVPWLDAQGLPSTFFVNAALASGANVKDSDIAMLAINRLGRARADQLRGVPAQLQALGCTREAIAFETRAYAPWDLLRRLPRTVSFGNHGEMHHRLSLLTDAQAVHEIDEGLRRLREELAVDRVPYAFAYGQPRDISVAARARAAATHTAVLSAYGGFSWPGCGVEDVPRVPVFSSRTPALLNEYAFPPRFLAKRARALVRG